MSARSAEIRTSNAARRDSASAQRRLKGPELQQFQQLQQLMQLLGVQTAAQGDQIEQVMQPRSKITQSAKDDPSQKGLLGAYNWRNAVGQASHQGELDRINGQTDLYEAQLRQREVGASPLRDVTPATPQPNAAAKGAGGLMGAIAGLFNQPSRAEAATSRTNKLTGLPMGTLPGDPAWNAKQTKVALPQPPRPAASQAASKGPKSPAAQPQQPQQPQGMQFGQPIPGGGPPVMNDPWQGMAMPQPFNPMMAQPGMQMAMPAPIMQNPGMMMPPPPAMGMQPMGGMPSYAQPPGMVRQLSPQQQMWDWQRQQLLSQQVGY